MVTNILEVFSAPSKYDLYNLMLKAFTNWSEVRENTQKAIAECDNGKCARCGFIFGKLLKIVLESDASLTGLVWS